VFRPFQKWPILLGAALCIVVGAVLIRDVPNGNIVTGLVLTSLGALLLGVFITLYTIDLVRDAKEPRPGPREGQDGAG
jgi:hypothetical protein